MVKAFPVTNCKGDYASLFLEVLNVHIATLTKESLNDTFLFQKYFEKIHDSVPSTLFTMESRQNQTKLGTDPNSPNFLFKISPPLPTQIPIVGILKS